MDQLTYDFIRFLRKGDKVYYKAGLGDHHVEASAIVLKDCTGNQTGVYIQIEKIDKMGANVNLQVGVSTLAGIIELYR